MFTGIIESLGIIKEVSTKGTNKSFWVESPISGELKIDQSLSHDGVCLTIETVLEGKHLVTAIDETIQKTNIANWIVGSIVNLERCLPINGRLDGHFVQGHIDCTGECINKKEKEGSWEFEIKFPTKFSHLIIEKGSICVSGVSLTAFNVKKKSFTVAIIPYTFEHSNLNVLEKGHPVNLEFDVLGKYIHRQFSKTNS